MDHYICLSHCWGAFQPLKTTKETLPKFKDNIPWDELPKTFQDAVNVTRWLGLRYLWIDSLCIIQDDQNDWQEQSAEMANIYGDALLVIAASVSRSSQSGFLAEVDPEIRKSFNITETTTDDAQVNVHVRRALCHGDHWTFPLDQRAWTLQEDLLAARVLYFYHDEIIYHCDSDSWCCCSETTRAQRHKAAMASGLTTPGKTVKTWHELVESYTKRRLTNEGDKLPALSGLARRFQQNFQMTYLAGLWQEQLIEDICWYVDGPRNRRHQPSSHCAPSWSWASVELPVEFPRAMMYHTMGTDGALTQSVLLGTLDPKLRVLGAECTSNSADPTGSVSGGFLKLGGCIVPATYRHLMKKWGPHFVERGNLLEPFYADCSVPLPDAATTLLDGDKILVLNLGQLHWPPDPPSKFRALVLKESKSHLGDFERIGLILSSENDSEDWFKHVQETVITVW